jgi:dipeptidyl aminopeptidase/acylaminoacyl peptidase
MTTDDLWDLPRVGSPSSDRSGATVVVPVTTVDTEGTSRTRLWLLGDGDPTALTAADASAAAPAVAPDGHAVAFVRAVDDRAQVHVLPLGGGEARQVTDLPLGVVGGVRWADDGRLLVVTRLHVETPTLEATIAWRDAAGERPDVLATERRLNRVWDTWYVDPLTEHVLLVDASGGTAPRDLTPGEWLLPDPLGDPAAMADVSPDRTLLAWVSTDPAGDADGVPVAHLRVVPVDGGEVRDLTPDVPGSVGVPRFLPDGRIVVPVSTDRDFYAAPRDLVAVDPVSGDRERLVDLGPDGLDLDLSDYAVTPDGGLVLGTEVRGRGRLLRVAPDGTTTWLAAPPTGGLGSPVVAGPRLLATHASVVQPPEVVAVDDEQVTPLTAFTAELVGQLDLGTSEERTVVGGNGDEVQVLLLHPPTAVAPDGPAPLVHLVHGGPHGTFGDTWHFRWSAARWAAEGWLVAMVNFHGSTSFGHAFTGSIRGDWATLPLADVEAATDALVADGSVDPERMAVAGGSYGGYLVTWITTQTDRYATSVAHAAVTDLAGMYASDWSNGLAEAHGAEVWTDPERTQRFSPSWHYGGITTPTLVLHGERDLRVPIDQGRALYGVLQARRVPSRFVVFPGENHWVLHRDTSTRWYAEVLGWLHRWLDVD